MKNNNLFNYKQVMMGASLVLIVGFFSCNNSGSTTSSTDLDSNGTKDNSMSTSTDNASGQGTHMNDGAGVGVNNNSNGSGNIGSNNNGSGATTSTDNSSNNSMSSDTSFMLKAAEISMEEIKLGKLAQQKGTASNVKKLAKMMVAEHTQAIKELTPLAKAKMVTLPVKETSKITDAYKTLNAKSGKEFDKAYSEMMVDGHKDAISLFEKTNSETKDAEIKAMTTAMLPKLKTHLEHAEMCKKESEKM